jgi:hypothetical protein
VPNFHENYLKSSQVLLASVSRNGTDFVNIWTLLVAADAPKIILSHFNVTFAPL